MTEKPVKSKQPKVARVELKAGGGLHEPENPGWSASGIEKWSENEKPPVRIKQQQQAISQKPPGGSLKSSIVGSFIELQGTKKIP